jgi:integrase|tara:strand:+ start:81 stop:1145 length:1065 start_codon:yes stop_codon:yes gene_type:complete
MITAKTKGIYQRGRIWWIRYTGCDGKMRFETTKSTSFKVAEKLLIQKKNDVMEGRNPDKRIKNYAFRELAMHYSDWATRQKSFKSKEGFIRQLVLEFGNCPLKKISTMYIEKWQTERLIVNKPATVNRLLATLKHMFTKALEWEMVTEETAQKIRRVRLLREDNKRLKFLTVEECQRLIGCCTPHLKPIVVVALQTGMRKGEILNLMWEQVDLRHGLILLDTTTKNGERREIPINKTLREMFNKMPHSIESIFVFTDLKTGEPYKEVKKGFKTALKKAGINNFRFHDLRHTFASHLVMAGIDLVTVKELLGHKSLSMTLRYAHLAPEHKVKALEVLDNTLNGISSIQKVYNLEE